jgi:lactate dehydrogenase-like 2-hydroxyacid dehydrogenase
MPNVVTLPYIGSTTANTRFDMAMMAATNLVKAAVGFLVVYALGTKGIMAHALILSCAFQPH